MILKGYKRGVLTSILALFTWILVFSQVSPKELGLASINENVLKGQLSFLASDWTEGRETGERGAWLSASYIASILQMAGVEPGGDFIMKFDPATRQTSGEKSYFQQFNLMKSSPGDIQQLALIINGKGVTKRIEFNYLTDFDVSPSEPGGTIEAPVVFVGYGYRDQGRGWDDFRNLDIKGKFIMRLPGLPPTLKEGSGTISDYRSSAEKDQVAISLGAAGIIEVDPGGMTGARWFEEEDFFNIAPAEAGYQRSSTRYSVPRDNISSSLPRVILSVRAANAILGETGITIDDFISGRKVLKQGVETSSAKIALTTTVKTSLVRVQNIIGVIEGKRSDEVIVLGAHYDHTGMHDGYIYNGADDNASGTVGIMTIARAILSTGVKPEKTIIIALWTGEEKGLLGSKYFVDNPTIPLEYIKMHLNFDMISRYINDDTPNAVTMTYTDSYPLFRDITAANLKKYNIRLDVDYQPSDDPPGGTDHRSFVAKGIAVLRFKPGHREEYHTPADEFGTIDWDIMEKIVKIGYLDIWDLANSQW